MLSQDLIFEKCPDCKHELRWTLKPSFWKPGCGDGAGMFGMAAKCECKDHRKHHKAWGLKCAAYERKERSKKRRK